jgi:hypothetical protein
MLRILFDARFRRHSILSVFIGARCNVPTTIGSIVSSNGFITIDPRSPLKRRSGIASGKADCFSKPVQCRIQTDE